MHLPAHTETVLLYPWRWQVCSLIWNTCPRVTEMHPVPLELFSTISLLLFLGPTWRRPICGSEMFPFGTQCPMTYRRESNQSPLQWPRGLRHTLLLRSSTGIVGSNPTRGTNVCVYVVLRRLIPRQKASYRLLTRFTTFRTNTQWAKPKSLSVKEEAEIMFNYVYFADASVTMSCK